MALDLAILVLASLGAYYEDSLIQGMVRNRHLRHQPTEKEIDHA
jgi:hypothetical protein